MNAKPMAKPTANGVDMLTDAEVKKAYRKGESKTLSDGSGRGSGRLLLTVRAAKNGVLAEWYAQQWKGDKRRLSKIGGYPDLSLADAREKFRHVFAGAISSGKDIRRADPERKGTVKQLFDDYVAALERDGKRSSNDARKTLRRVGEAIGENRIANTITSEDVIEAVRPTYLRGKKVMADAMRGYVHSAYQWAIRAQNDYRVENANGSFAIKHNPAHGIPTEQKVPGERWLTADELGAFWKWLEGGGNPKPGKQATLRSNLVALMVVMTTGQRVEEIARITTETMNERTRSVEWTKTKNGRPHHLPMPSVAFELLRAVEPNEYGLLFPAMFFSAKPVHNQTLHRVVSRYVAETGAKPFVPRDLRRTWKTLSGEAGISKDDRDRIQNHALSDVGTIHYDRYAYFKEKQAAMEVWNAWFVENVLKQKAPN